MSVTQSGSTPNKQSNSISWQYNLVNWFQKNQRFMPWRDEQSPYRTWVSEVMLQQTQVDTVIPYFNAFMSTFPTIEDLAKAEEDAVLKSWEGLGYYSRARNLHSAAKNLVATNKGNLPNTFKSLQTVKGIGPYIASAIASIAFNEAVPVVDGNVLRVFSRFWADTSDIKKPKTRTEFFDRLSQSIKGYPPAEFNQGMMELGALICSPKKPKCPKCPLQPNCIAFATNRISEYPVATPKKKAPHYTIVVGIISRNGNLLITKRKPNQLLGGLWEFPGGKVEENEQLEAALHREIMEECNITISIMQSLKPIKHAYSHFKITLYGFLAEYKSGTLTCKSAETYQWVSKKDLCKYAFPKANNKLLSQLNDTISAPLPFHSGPESEYSL